MSLEAYAYPLIGDLRPDAIDGAAVLRCVKPEWETKCETMRRVRSKIEAVLNHATATGHRADTPNPARWKGGLQSSLAAKKRIAPVEHRKAMEYGRVPSFLSGLRRSNGVTARALEFRRSCARHEPTKSWARHGPNLISAKSCGRSGPTG